MPFSADALDVDECRTLGRGTFIWLDQSEDGADPRGLTHGSLSDGRMESAGEVYKTE
jgi:hypothetical protein